ncbi:hypothetical protein HNR68_003407 [Saccharopolyspora hordei]|uniref:Uncharacterized protein n=1 Tax=Saccharopolyspora hordei TaxID=1838 RepID=A0A853ASB0_9PSEU|nr:hypothetical protein [Saccharopolyspora hordei]
MRLHRLRSTRTSWRRPSTTRLLLKAAWLEICAVLR